MRPEEVSLPQRWKTLRAWSGLGGLLGVHPVGRLLGLAGGHEDGPGILLQDLEPGRDVGGVVWPRLVGDAQIGKDEAAEDLDHDLLKGVRRRAKAAREVAGEPMRGAGGVPALM